jgi:hypothetical protein
MIKSGKVDTKIIPPLAGGVGSVLLVRPAMAFVFRLFCVLMLP